MDELLRDLLTVIRHPGFVRIQRAVEGPLPWSIWIRFAIGRPVTLFWGDTAEAVFASALVGIEQFGPVVKVVGET